MFLSGRSFFLSLEGQKWPAILYGKMPGNQNHIIASGVNRNTWKTGECYTAYGAGIYSLWFSDLATRVTRGPQGSPRVPKCLQGSLSVSKGPNIKASKWFQSPESIQISPKICTAVQPNWVLQPLHELGIRCVFSICLSVLYYMAICWHGLMVACFPPAFVVPTQWTVIWILSSVMHELSWGNIWNNFLINWDTNYDQP